MQIPLEPIGSYSCSQTPLVLPLPPPPDTDTLVLNDPCIYLFHINQELSCKHVKFKSLRNIQVPILSVVGHMVTIFKNELIEVLLRYKKLYLFNIYNLVSLEISIL